MLDCKQLASAYHENAMISMQAYFPIKTLEKTIKYDYLPESRNLNMERVYVNSRKGRGIQNERMFSSDIDAVI